MFPRLANGEITEERSLCVSRDVSYTTGTVFDIAGFALREQGCFLPCFEIEVRGYVRSA